LGFRKLILRPYTKLNNGLNAMLVLPSLMKAYDKNILNVCGKKIMSLWYFDKKKQLNIAVQLYTAMYALMHSPEDKRLEVVSLPGTGSGCVTCSTSSALAESCTLKSKPPENANMTDGPTCSLVPRISQIFMT
jgi:hypothetical protein